MTAHSRDNLQMRGVRKAAALTIAVLAMALRVALPDGWMPATDLSSPLMLCPGMNDIARMPAMPGMDHAPQKPSPGKDHGGVVCPFAAAAHSASPARSAPAPQDVSRSARPWQPNAARAPPQSI